MGRPGGKKMRTKSTRERYFGRVSTILAGLGWPFECLNGYHAPMQTLSARFLCTLAAWARVAPTRARRASGSELQGGGPAPRNAPTGRTPLSPTIALLSLSLQRLTQIVGPRPPALFFFAFRRFACVFH